MERRLAAILAADVVDYTRLMGEDEARMLAALVELRDDLLQPKLQERNGAVIKRMGDGWFVEFANVADAVACAISIQEGLQDHMTVRLRIGIHIGDVTFHDDDIYGDGINVAARLEALAEPGQVLISDMVHHTLDDKTSARFSGGEVRELKNVSRGVAVWHWPPGVEADTITDDSSILFQQTAEGNPQRKVTILPFATNEETPEALGLADLLSEEIANSISDANEPFGLIQPGTAANNDRDPIGIGQKLNVDYVLDGSIFRTAEQGRVAVKLIQTDIGQIVWRDRYDFALDDLFQVAERIGAEVGNSLGENILDFEYKSSPTQPIDTNLLLIVARLKHNEKQPSRENFTADLALLTKARETFGDHPQLLFSLAWQHLNRYAYLLSTDLELDLCEGRRFAQMCYDLNPRASNGQLVLGSAMVLNGENIDDALSLLNESVAGRPSNDTGVRMRAIANLSANRFEAALQDAEVSQRLNPKSASIHVTWHLTAAAKFLLGDIKGALELTKRAAEFAPHYFYAHALAAVCQFELGDKGAAAKHITVARSLGTDITKASYFAATPGLAEHHRQRIYRVLEGLGWQLKDGYGRDVS